MCEAALPQRLLHGPRLVSTEKFAKGPVVGREGNESALEAHSPAFVPFPLRVHLGVGAVCLRGPRPALSQSPSGVTSVPAEAGTSEPALPRPLGLGFQRRSCVLIAFRLLPAGSCRVHPDAGTRDVPVSPSPPPSPPPTAAREASHEQPGRWLGGRLWTPGEQPLHCAKGSSEERGPKGSLGQVIFHKAPAPTTGHGHYFSSHSPAEYSVTGRPNGKVGLCVR